MSKNPSNTCKSSAAARCSNTRKINKAPRMARPLALTLGEPAGIGPDITFAAWRRRAELDLAPFYLLADPDFVARCAQRIAPDVPIAVVEPAAAATSFASALPRSEEPRVGSSGREKA